MIKIKDIKELEDFLKHLITLWNDDIIKVKRNCLINTVSLDYQLKYNFINKSRMCYGAKKR